MNIYLRLAAIISFLAIWFGIWLCAVAIEDLGVYREITADAFESQSYRMDRLQKQIDELKR